MAAVNGFSFKERFLLFQLLFPDFYHFHHVIWRMKWAKTLKRKNGQNMSSGPFLHDAAQMILLLLLLLSVKTSYRGITDYHSNKIVISTSATKELYEDLNFQQIRYHCSKQLGRTFHVVTAADSSGKAVVQYFSGLTGVLPDSCGSFERMADDDSRLSRRCSEWLSGAGS